MTNKIALQDLEAPNSICFGCGPANSQGLQIKSFPGTDGRVRAEWKGLPQHQAFPGILNGGIIGALLDCHCNWTAAWHLRESRKSLKAPTTVTAQYSIELKRPTPADQSLQIESWVSRSEGSKVWVEGTLSCKGEICAKVEGLFVAVREGHPAYGRW